MPRCHQCSNNTGVGARDGDCKVCYSKGVPFCQRCAMWELGPVDADVDLPAALKLAARELDSERQDRDKSVDDLNKLGDEPLACDTFLPTLGAACAFFNDQLTNARATLYGEPFRDYCCKVLDRFQELYPTCKYDRLAIQVLIAMHLSSQERVQCRDIQDGEGKSTSAAARVVKRWHTRQVAEKHLSAHFDDIQAEFGKTIRDLVERRAWRVALASDALELWLKGFKHPTLAAIDLLAAAGSADVAREALEVWLIVYHSLTAARTKSEVGAHWSAKIGDADFQPKEALGFVSKEHFVYLYGDTEDAADFTEEAQARIEQLWNVLGDASPANALPAHPRYADVTVSANGLLDDAEKAYLQYLPTFDRPHAQRDQRTPCEAAVHARVRATLKNYLTSYAPAEWRAEPTLEPIAWVGVAETKGRTKTLVVTAPARVGHPSLTLTFGPSGTHATSTLVSTEKAKIPPWIRGLLDADALRADDLKLTLQVTGETGNTRRAARRTAVETELRAVFDQEKVPVSFKPAFVDDAGTLKDDAPLDAYIDDLIAKMWADFCVDQAFDCGVSKLIVHGAVVPRRFVPQAWFPLKSEEILYSDLFPECRDCFGPDSLDGVGVHYEAVGGSSARPAHYMDWRNHKDRWLYDCFDIQQRRRPVFGSLSTQPFLPGPNPNYGGHILFYRRDQIRSRCLFTFGDKQQPRRSMLLTLDTVLHGRTKKDGAAAQSREGREEVVYRILSRYDHILKYHALNAQQLWAKTFEGKKVPYPNGDLLIECQIFGGLDLARDAWGFVPECETDPFFDDKFHIKTETLQANEGAVNALYPNMQILRYYFRDYQPIGAVTARNAPWKHHLSEIAE